MYVFYNILHLTPRACHVQSDTCTKNIREVLEAFCAGANASLKGCQFFSCHFCFSQGITSHDQLHPSAKLLASDASDASVAATGAGDTRPVRSPSKLAPFGLVGRLASAKTHHRRQKD